MSRSAYQVGEPRAVLRGSSWRSGTSYAEARDWVESYEAGAEQRPLLEQELLESLTAARIEAWEAQLFRGRILSTAPCSVHEFGPPPPDQAQRGRYSETGVPALHLCSSVNGVIRELGPPSPGLTLWVQTFRLRPELRFADARDLAVDSLAAAIFWLIEPGRDRMSPFPLLGQRIGRLIATEFDGLLVPGVRGEPNELYWNVVVFRPCDRWLSLIDESVRPEAAS